MSIQDLIKEINLIKFEDGDLINIKVPIDREDDRFVEIMSNIQEIFEDHLERIGVKDCTVATDAIGIQVDIVRKDRPIRTHKDDLARRRRTGY